MTQQQNNSATSEWVTRRIGDLGRVVTGKTPTTKDTDNFGGDYPFITIPDLDGRVNIDHTARTLSEKGADRVKSSLLPPRAVMMSCIATVGKCGVTTKPSFTNQQINSVIPDDKTDSRFLYYIFTQLGHDLDIVGGGGSIYTNVSKSRFSDIEVSLPPLPEQRRIAHMLGTLDDKIELNRRMNETLDEMARAIFKDWFVDFGPVRAKMEGRDAYLPDDIWNLFPDSLADSELGQIPDGWEVKALDEIANFRNGLALQKFRPKQNEDRLPVVKIAQLRSGYTKDGPWASANITPECIIDDGDVVFAWSGSLMVKVWCGGQGALNQHLFKVTSAEYPKWLCFHYTNHHLPEFQRIAADKTTTMGHIKRHHLSDAKCVIPNQDLLSAMDGILDGLLVRSIAASVESRTLAAMRDTLLPKLVSGEVRVSVDADDDLVCE